MEMNSRADADSRPVAVDQCGALQDKLGDSATERTVLGASDAAIQAVNTDGDPDQGAGGLRCVQLTSLHPVFDTRIFVKQCRSLVEAGYDVTLIAAHEQDDHVQQVRIRAVPRCASRVRRVVITLPQLLFRALQASGAVYHFHDPELIPIGMLLKLCGKTVVYDVHEDYPRAVLIKPWLPAALRRTVSVAVAGIEAIAGLCFDGIVAATSTIGDRFPSAKTIVVQNYPRVDEFSEPELLRPFQQRGQDVAYVGAISVERGIREMVDAMQHLADSRGARMIIAGDFSESDVKQAVRAKPGWKHVEHMGWCSRAQVHDVLNRSRVGLVTLHPTPSYLVSNPVKLYEYMAAGLPVVASDFPMWRQVVSQADCGILVDPFNPREIAEAVAWLLDNPIEAERMGRRGRQAIHNRLNWGHEVQKLLDLYARFDSVAPATRGTRTQLESAPRAA